MATSPRLKRLFDDYASYHRTAGNKAMHMLGIPLIMMTLLGLLSTWVIPLPGIDREALFRLDGGILLWIIGVVYYSRVDWKIGGPFSLVALGIYFAGRSIPWAGLWTLQVLGWVFQAIGHAVYEKKAPAFLKNIQHVLIGPLWIFARLVGYIR